MKRWEHGDPVGAGAVYLPDQRTREAYGAACRDKQIEAWADLVCSGATIEIRRSTLQQCPRSILTDVKTRVREKWQQLKK